MFIDENRGTMSTEDLAERLWRLEKLEDAEEFIHTAGFLCDSGPYPPDELTALWSPDGYYDTGSTQLHGRAELRAFYDSLAAEYTIHFFTNVFLRTDERSEVTHAHCLCFEAPILAGTAHFGAFEHEIEIRTAPDERAWRRRVQRVDFLTPFEAGWSGDAVRIAEQHK